MRSEITAKLVQAAIKDMKEWQAICRSHPAVLLYAEKHGHSLLPIKTLEEVEAEYHKSKSRVALAWFLHRILESRVAHRASPEPGLFHWGAQ